MTSSIGSTTSTTATTTATPAGNKPLDREAFLKLLVAQIAHQDPLSPMQGTEFVSQLSQFAMVEQSIAQSAHLETVQTQLHGISNEQASTLVGKTVTMRSRALAFDGTLAATTGVTLGSDAAKTKVEIVDENDRVVRTLDMGSRAKGPLAITWDGKSDDGTVQPKGNYKVKVTATDAAGKPVTSTQDSTGVVTKVSYEKGYPELTLDNGATGAIADLVSVAAPPAPAANKQ